MTRRDFGPRHGVSRIPQHLMPSLSCALAKSTVFQLPQPRDGHQCFRHKFYAAPYRHNLEFSFSSGDPRGRCNSAPCQALSLRKNQYPTGVPLRASTCNHVPTFINTLSSYLMSVLFSSCACISYSLRNPGRTHHHCKVSNLHWTASLQSNPLASATVA